MNLGIVQVLADGLMLPKGASNLAPDVDWAWSMILYVTTLFFFIVVGAAGFFVIRYRRRTPNDVTSEITHNTPLEIIWTAVPMVLVLAFFYIGFKGFEQYDNPLSNCVTVDVQGQKWFFTFTYPNGATSPDLYVLIDQPVKLNMHSTDVLHALYIPAFRTQRNLVPFRLTNIWFIPKVLTDREGYQLSCTQYCGNGHSQMQAHVFVLDKVAYAAKMDELANPFKVKVGGKSTFVPYSEVGAKLYKEMGCVSCHSVDTQESIGTGPPWHGLWKRDHEPFAATNEPGYTLKAADPDEKWNAYLDESIKDPDAKLVTYKGKAYHGMTSFSGVLTGSESADEKRYALEAYIKSLGGWKPDVDPIKNPDLYDADNPKLIDEHGVPVHPESQAGIRLRKGGTQSAPATGAGN